MTDEKILDYESISENKETGHVYEYGEKVYTKLDIILATAMGGPFAAGHLMGHNFIVFNQNENKKSAYRTAAIFYFFLLVAFLISITLFNEKGLFFSFIIIQSIFTFLASHLYTNHQEDKVKNYLAEADKSKRHASFVNVIIVSIVSLGAAILIPFASALAFMSLLFGSEGFHR
jgi:hypothetical protein